MKFSKILTTAFVALGATLALSGCIRETFPKESAITQEQLMSGQIEIVAENLMKGIPRSMLTPQYDPNTIHGDYGWPAVGVFFDMAAQTIVANGWSMGWNAGYNRYYMPAWGWQYGTNGWMPHYFWYVYYPIIKSCNDLVILLEGNEDMADYVAIARTYRALLYLDLARLFEALPIDPALSADYAAQQAKVAGLTVPIVNEFTGEDDAKQNPRATREEMFKFILSDLAAAEEVFDSEDYKPMASTDPTLAVVYGLYARTYLWLGGFNDFLSGELPEGNEAYAKAAEYARMAIEEFGGAIMSEAEWTNVTTGFNTKASSWMWTLTHSSDTVANNLIQFPAHMAPEASYGYTPYSHPGVSSVVYERLNDTDFRKKLIISPTHYKWGTIINDENKEQLGWIIDESKVEAAYEAFKPYTQLSIEEFVGFSPYTFFKFRPAQGERTDHIIGGTIQVPLMRCEEMYFIEMEALHHTEGATAAVTKLAEFMANRDSNYVIRTNDYLDEILFQKHLEFWGEGVAMFDMKRLNIGVNTAYEGTNYDPDRRFIQEGRLPWWTPMIPKGEVDVNKGINEDTQNPDPTNLVLPVTSK